jgi:hypothetical protein
VISVPKIRSIVEESTGRQADAAAAKLTAARFARDPREFATATGTRVRVLPGGEDAARG